MPEKKIILDCDLMQYRNSGLYYYCLNLGLHLQRILAGGAEEQMWFYGSINDTIVFGKENCIEEGNWSSIEKKLNLAPRKLHRRVYKGIKGNREIWHAPFQSGRILPSSNEYLKIVLTIHDLNQLHEANVTAAQAKESLLNTQALIDKSDMIICISDYCKQDVITHLDTGNTPVHVIHNGTNDMAAVPVKPMSYKPHGPFLFTLGYVNRKKNFHVLLPLLTAQPDLELIIAGKPDDEDYLLQMQQKADELGASERFHVVGQISEADKAWYFKHCQAFMFPSVAEGFGLPVTEAMSFGKPLFLSPLTSLPEIGGDVAFYFPDFQKESMIHVFKEGMRTYEKNGLSEKIVERGKAFNWERSAHDYLDIYRSLL